MSVNLSKGNCDIKSSTESNIEELENLRKSVNILAEKLKYQEIDGSGIGLTIVKNILNLHNASIDVESKENEWQLLRFTLTKILIVNRSRTPNEISIYWAVWRIKNI